MPNRSSVEPGSGTEEGGGGEGSVYTVVSSIIPPSTRNLALPDTSGRIRSGLTRNSPQIQLRPAGAGTSTNESGADDSTREHWSSDSL